MFKIIFIIIFLQVSNIACSKINKPLPTNITTYKQAGIYKVAASLAELGYFTYSLKKADIESVKAAVKLFQQDIKVEPTGLLDDITWGKLQTVQFSVFVIDKIECKSSHEAFVLFYQGKLQKTDKVNINKRYALWYDTKRKGINRKDWWCIPKKRFCSSKINFTDWRGKLKPGDIGTFNRKLITTSRSNLESLVATTFNNSCFQ